MRMRERYRVRPFERSEAEHLAALGGKLHAESALRKFTFDARKTESWFVHVHGNPKQYFQAVIADENDNAIGVLIALISGTYYGPDLVANDMLFFVDAKHRGKAGVQVMVMIDQYKQWAKARGAKAAIIAGYLDINKEALASLLEKLDFKQVGTVHMWR